MKIINKFRVFSLVLLLAILTGILVFAITENKPAQADKTYVNGVEQQFPKKLSNDFEIVSATLDENLITIYLRDKNDGSIIESSLPSGEIESLVCNLNEYNGDKIVPVYDCTTEESLVDAMIMEVGKQTLEIIEKEGV